MKNLVEYGRQIGENFIKRFSMMGSSNFLIINKTYLLIRQRNSKMKIVTYILIPNIVGNVF